MSEVTIYTLAKELNMTPSMVSRAFNPAARISEEKRKTVLAAAARYGFSPNKMASRLSMRTVRIGIVLICRFPVNTEKMQAGIRCAHEALRDYKIGYEVTVLSSAEITEQDVRAAIAKYEAWDGVILSGMSAAEYTDIITELQRKNGNVVQVQAVNADADCLFSSKHDERVASSLAAELLGNALWHAPRKNVLLFTGDGKSALHARARDAFSSACAVLGLTLLDTFDMKDSEEELSRILPSVFARYGEAVDGIYITSGVSVSLCRYLAEHGYRLPLITFDTYDEIREYMRAGVICATVAQNVAKQMENAFTLLVKHLITGAPCPKTVYTDVQPVFRSNIHQFD